MPRLYEWTATIESGLSLELDKPSQRWRGHRIRYRRQGERRWRSFLLSLDTGLTPSDADVIRAIEAHEEHTAGEAIASRNVDVLEREAPHLLAPSSRSEAADHDA